MMSRNLWRQQVLQFTPKVKLIRKISSQVKSDHISLKKNHINVPTSMSAWSLKDYNGICSLGLLENVDIPIIQKPSDVLVKVHASSINNLDVMMTDGYGKEIFENYKKLCNNLKCSSQETFAPILGRDFAGTVVAVGEAVKNLKPGQEVMGFVPPPICGSHAQFVIASSCNMQIKPSISMEEAAAVPFAGLTAWSALKYSAEMCMGAKGKTVLVLGASGGVGIFAVQLLKNWGSTVVSTCSSDAMQYVSEIGSDFVVDYTSPLAQQELLNYGGFDVILDCTGQSEHFSYDLLKPWSNAKFVTLSPPVLRNLDLHGIMGGFVKNGFDLIVQNSTAIIEGKTMRWAFFVPSSSALIELCGLIRDRKLKIIIDSVFSYDKLPDAYAKMKDGHTRGKIIVKMC